MGKAFCFIVSKKIESVKKGKNNTGYSIMNQFNTISVYCLINREKDAVFALAPYIIS